MNLNTIKKHLRLTFDYDDEVLNNYLNWAEKKIKSSVNVDYEEHSDYFFENFDYDRAVVLLVAHYYENRKPTTDRPQYNMIYGIEDAIFHMKYDYQRKYGVLDEL